MRSILAKGQRAFHPAAPGWHQTPALPLRPRPGGNKDRVRRRFARLHAWRDDRAVVSWHRSHGLRDANGSAPPLPFAHGKRQDFPLGLGGADRKDPGKIGIGFPPDDTGPGRPGQERRHAWPMSRDTAFAMDDAAHRKMALAV